MMEYCPICNGTLTWEHDHQPDMSGLDDGPYLPPEPRKRRSSRGPTRSINRARSGQAPRQKMVPKSAEEVRAIRLRAWETRRNRYGPYGHR
jgi:hypothetical protein